MHGESGGGHEEQRRPSRRLRPSTRLRAAGMGTRRRRGQLGRPHRAAHVRRLCKVLGGLVGDLCTAVAAPPPRLATGLCERASPGYASVASGELVWDSCGGGAHRPRAVLDAPTARAKARAACIRAPRLLPPRGRLAALRRPTGSRGECHVAVPRESTRASRCSCRCSTATTAAPQPADGRAIASLPRSNAAPPHRLPPCSRARESCSSTAPSTGFASRGRRLS